MLVPICDGTDATWFDAETKKDPAVMSGRTRQNKLVHFRPPHRVRPGAYALVEIIGAAPHHLSGEFVEQTAEPIHRLRIPVTAG